METPTPTSRSPRRLVGTLLAMGAATATVVFGSSAAWNAQTTNPGNSVTSGTLTFTNSKDAAAVFTTVPNAKPGDTGGGSVTITNAGSIPMAVTLTQGSVTDNGFGTDIEWQLHDDTRDYCYWPTQAAGACSGYGAWDATATLTGLAIPATDGSAKWPAAQAHTFTVNWRFKSTAGNATQGKTASFGLTWDGAQ